MKSIKSFIYLDEIKMYSVSSQLFEGLTDYIIDYKMDKKSEETGQKGPFASGRKLANIIIKEGGTKEIKFLHDYSYNLFEEKLIEDDKVLQIKPDNFESQISKINEFSFIKVSGRCHFFDVNMVNETMEQFNKIGESLAYLITHETRAAAKQELTNQHLKDKSKLHKEYKKLENTKNIAQQMGLAHDPELLNKLVFLTKYGYKDHFEIQIPIPSLFEEKYIFTSVLKREYLKEKEDIIIKKYSRTSEKSFTLFGFITQSSFNEATVEKQLEVPVDLNNLKRALLNLILKFAELEKSFIGKLSNEVIIDPIALYIELS